MMNIRVTICPYKRLIHVLRSNRSYDCPIGLVLRNILLPSETDIAHFMLEFNKDIYNVCLERFFILNLIKFDKIYEEVKCKWYDFLLIFLIHINYSLIIWLFLIRF